MGEKINKGLMAIAYAVSGRAEADAQELFEKGVRADTLSPAVADVFANRFRSDFENDLNTFPVARPDKEMIDNVTQNYKDGLSMFLTSKELKSLLSE